MMFMSRHGGGRVLRALAIASAIALGAGAAALAFRAEAAPAVQSAAMWTRDAALPGVRLMRVDGARHFIMADQPERFAEILDRFLAD